MPKQLSLWPLGGFVNSIPRLDVPLSCLTGNSTDWLVGRKRLRRRAGSSIYGDTLSGGAEVSGILEEKWSAKCRRLVSAALGSLSDGFPTVLGLWVNEATKAATLAFRNTNDDSWQTVGGDYSSTHYPAASVPHFRAMPMVYENANGGLTFHRLTESEYRRHFAGGSRSILQRAGTIAVPGYTSAPSKWDGGFNDATDSGEEVCTVAPLGLIPPMQMPTCSAGNNLSTDLGPWRGNDAFFYTVLFENEEGELSMFCIPRPENSAYKGFPGFGYMCVDADNGSDYFDSVVYSNIPDGPPGTRWKRLARSPKVDIAETGAGAIVQPSSDALYFIPFARIPQGVHTYTDTAGNDASLDADPRIAALMDLVWPPRARNAGHFDGHYTLGDLKPNPYALLVAPWDDGNRNYPIDDARLYAEPFYYVAVTPTQLVLRKLAGGVATDTTYDLADMTLRELVDRITSNAADTTVDHECSFSVLTKLLTCEDTNFDDVYVGDLVVSAKYPAGTVVAGKITSAIIVTSERPEGMSGGDSETVTFAHAAADDAVEWAAQPVPGADAGAKADELLRTLVESACTWSASGTTLTLYGPYQADSEHITPGMRVYLAGAFAEPTTVTAVDEDAHTIAVDSAALRANAGTSENVLFAYDTGDARTAVAGTAVVAEVGTYTTSSEGVLVSDSFDLAAGSAVVAALTTRDEVIPYLYFAGHRMTRAAFKASGSATTELWYYVNRTAATITGHVSRLVRDDDSTSLAVLTVAGLADIATHDASAEAAGTSGTANSGSTDTLAQADEVCIGVVGTDTADTRPAGVWGQSWTALQRDGTAAGDDTTVSTAYKVVASTTAVSVTKTALAADEDWAALCVTFRIAQAATITNGYVRMFGNAFPVALPWRKSYLDQFKAERQAVIFTGASPGFAQNALNTWFSTNRRSGQSDLGAHIGSADLGPAQMEFYARGRMLLHNPRTGETHNDDDYTLAMASWTRGARSPYAICEGGGWAIFLSDDGLFACDAHGGEALLSKAVYDAEAPVGERGALEAAIAACIVASESDADTYKVSAQVHASVIRVRFYKDANSTYFDRELRYDFSAGVGRTGIAELLREDGSPYPWSAPLTLPVSCSAEVVDSDGKHLYAARDTNAGTGDGRVDEVDTGTEDNGVKVRPMGYTGVAWPEGLNKTQVLRSRVVARKAGTGLHVGLARNPEREPEESEWDDLAIGTSAAREYVRDLQPFDAPGRMGKEAVGMRIFDDGTGPCPEVIMVLADVRDAESNTTTEGGA